MKNIIASAEIYTLVIAFFALFYAFNARTLQGIIIATIIAVIADLASYILHRYNKSK